MFKAIATKTTPATKAATKAAAKKAAEKKAVTKTLTRKAQELRAKRKAARMKEKGIVVKPIPKNPADVEGARLDPTTKGSTRVARQQEKDIVSNRTGKVTAAKDQSFLQLQRTKGTKKRAEALVELERRSKDKTLSKAERNEAAKAAKKMDNEGARRSRTRDVRSSQTQRKNVPVSLAKTSADKPKGKAKPKKEVYSKETGEVHTLPKEFDSMTKNQKDRYLRNLNARSNIAEDLSDAGMAKAGKKKVKDARVSRDVRKKAYGGNVKTERKKKSGFTVGGGMDKGVKRKKGGKVGKPKGVGCATRGYGKAMK